MSLPARQRRALDRIERALLKSEPRMAAMFTMFTRLTHDDGPALTERLSGFRLLASTRLRAVVLVPVVLAMLLTGALLGGGGGARGSNCAPRLTGFAQNASGGTVPGRSTCRRLTQPSTSARPVSP